MGNKTDDLSGLGEEALKKTKLYDEQNVDDVKAQMGVKKSPYAIPNNLNISKKAWTKIEKMLTDLFVQIDQDKDEMRDKLEVWESAYLQEPIDINPDEEPFENSCKLRSSFTATACTVVSNKIYKRTTLSPYFLATVRGDKDKEKKLQDYVNAKCELDFDYKKFMRELSVMVPKYPFVIAVPERVREIQPYHDFDIFENIYETDESTGEEVLSTQGIDLFKKKYPNGKGIGLTSDQYKEKVKELKEELDDHDFCEFHYDSEKVYEYSDVGLVHPLNYAQFPWDCKPDLAKLSGIKLEKTFDQLLRLERDSIIKDDSAKIIPARYIPSDNEDEVDVVKEMKDESQGVSDSHILETYKSKIFKPYKGHIRLSDADLEIGDSYLEKDYEFMYMVDEKILLRLAPPRYNYKKRNTIKISIGDMCIPEMAANPQKVLDTLVRQYIDSNSMTNVPEFTMNDSSYVALSRQRNGLKHRIGKIWRIKSGDMQPLNKPITYGPAYMSIVAHITQDNESRIGSTRSSTGQPIAGDPTASGVKTMALLQQSDFMVSRYTDTVVLGLSEVITHLVKQDRQFEKFMSIPVRRDSLGSNKEDLFSRDDIEFDENVTSFTLKSQSAEDNSEVRLANAMKRYEFHGAVPIIANRPQSMRILAKNVVSADDGFTREEANDLIPSEEELKAEQALILKDAMVQLQKQKESEALNQEVQDVAEQGENQIDEVLKEQQTV